VSGGSVWVLPIADELVTGGSPSALAEVAAVGAVWARLILCSLCWQGGPVSGPSQKKPWAEKGRKMLLFFFSKKD
jgi:hypothetical protein